ncbi:hypothetical protein HPB49_019593 [Dermacentor silvarum]|uniref:Uncharacterized protein n=1 Tax=Dermacentor silvarum TaxID=543639 RepID=A0ACB8CB26_DERSI|nr:hypothetical protein HPB49_019593 [Dermacentor silvarum]
MTESCPAASETPASAGTELAPNAEQPPENPAAANSQGADDLSNSQENMVYEELPGGRSMIFIAWVFCCVGSIIVLVPLAFFLLPFFSGTRARVHHAVAGGFPSTASDVLVISNSASIPIPTWTVPQRPTVAVPTNCRRRSPTIDVKIKDIKNDSFEAINFTKTTRPVYCIYNISRVHRSSGRDFLLHQFPWGICPNIIYWSLAVNLSNGHIYSRAPELDAHSGFYTITAFARNYSKDTRVLFTVGGYPEERGLFSLLGNDTLAGNNMVQTAITLLYRLQFNGLNVHLAEDPDCERYFKGTLGGLQSFIVGLRDLVDLNGPIKDFKVTLMVDTNKQLAISAQDTLGELIDLVFVDTFKLFSSSTHASSAYCSSYRYFLSTFKNVFVNDSKICYSFSSLTRTWNAPNSTVMGPPLAVTKRPGYASYQDFCDPSYHVRRSLITQNCYSVNISEINGRPLAIAIVYTTSGIRRSRIGDKCFLLDNIDYGVRPSESKGKGDTLLDVLEAMGRALY